MVKEKSFQGISHSYLQKLIVRCSFLFIAGIFLASIIFYFSSLQTTASTYLESFKLLIQLRHEILTKSIVIYSSATLFIIAGISCICVFYSHRIVGPIYRLTQFVKSIADGDLSGKVVLRGNDELQSLAGSLNRLVWSYNKNVRELAVKCRQARQTFSEFSSEEQLDFENYCSRLSNDIKEIETEVEKLKL
jgi:nitrogen fixation/metabolism regulation signal transduction histidine kinase